MRIPGTRDCGTLLELDEIRRQLRLGAPVLEGERTIRVDQIVGTVGRARDFDGCFRPLHPALEKRIAEIVRSRPTVADEPIEVYRVDRAYFVQDGHKRVSVARVEGREFIDARVSHLASAYELAPGVDQESIDRTGRELAFREATGLLSAVPDARFPVSDPEAYGELTEAVRAYGFATSQAVGRLLGTEEVAGSWYACVYRPTVRVGRRSRIEELLPVCTDADLFLVLHRQSRTLLGSECNAAETAVQQLVRAERRGLRAGTSAFERLLRRLHPRAVEPLLEQIASPDAQASPSGEPSAS